MLQSRDEFGRFFPKTLSLLEVGIIHQEGKRDNCEANFQHIFGHFLINME